MTAQHVSIINDGLNAINVNVTWDFKSSERKIGDIFHFVTAGSAASLTQFYAENVGEINLVYLEQDAETSPCLLRLQCAPHPSVLISSLLVVSEARTLEAYSGAGEYCGTCRGERYQAPLSEGDAEGVPLFRKYLQLESPLASCDVKLLSLGGRTRVGIAGIVLGLQEGGTASAGISQVAGQGIDLNRVQSMVDSMGTTLSPGAQSLMNMVQFQQKSTANSLSGFLPLLLGSGGLAAMAKAGVASRAAAADTPALTTAGRGHTDSSSPGQSYNPTGAINGAETPFQSLSTRAHDHCDPQLTDAVLSLLNGHPRRRPVDLGQDLHSVLQGVCGQVAQLRIGDGSTASAAPAGTGEEHSCCRGLELRVERRLEEMEERLKQHMDQRLDALQQRLERCLLTALPLAHLPPGIKGACVPDWHGLLNGDA
ncbi:hypothetical protein GJAV_G00149280 [Gymnothorax javanicus]|nr:hypothetical protein GJAV_G00149280 [Gymnothorax javanicus]